MSLVYRNGPTVFLIGVMACMMSACALNSREDYIGREIFVERCLRAAGVIVSDELFFVGYRVSPDNGIYQLAVMDSLYSNAIKVYTCSNGSFVVNERPSGGPGAQLRASITHGAIGTYSNPNVVGGVEYTVYSRGRLIVRTYEATSPYSDNGSEYHSRFQEWERLLSIIFEDSN